MARTGEKERTTWKRECIWKDSININLRDDGVNWVHLALSRYSVGWCCGDNEPSGSIKRGEFLDYTEDTRLCSRELFC